MQTINNEHRLTCTELSNDAIGVLMKVGRRGRLRWEPIESAVTAYGWVDDHTDALCPGVIYRTKPPAPKWIVQNAYADKLKDLEPSESHEIIKSCGDSSRVISIYQGGGKWLDVARGVAISFHSNGTYRVREAE